MAVISAAGTRPQPTGGFELWSWVFMRVSGVALLGLALGHLWLMHILHTVDEIDYAFVAQRYGQALSVWRWYDMSLLVLAMLHGLNGVRILIDDYIHPPLWHRISCAALYMIGGAFLVVGAIVILIFQPQAAP